MVVLPALIAASPPPNRHALSREFCRRIGWLKPDGGLKDMMARVAMLATHNDGLIVLPPPKWQHPPRRPMVFGPDTEPLPFPAPTILDEVRPLRDALWFGLYTGMRREEVLTLRWERVDPAALTFRVEETKTGVPLELPITRQLAAIFERRRAAADDYPPGVRDWVFPSPTSATGHVQDIHHLYSRISKAGGAKFWFHGLRNCFITVAERELMLPSSLTKRPR